MHQTQGYSEIPNILELFKLGLVDVMLKGHMPYNPPVWTMMLELYGSLAIFMVMPLVAAIKDGKSLRWVSVAIYAVAIFLFHNSIYIGFILGALLAQMSLYDNVQAMMKGSKKYWVPVASVVGLYLCGYMV